jgi:proteasome alpha subunit
MTLSEVLRLAVDVLGAGENGERRALDAAQLEVAVLDRDRPRRSFRRIVGPLLTRLLGEPRETTDAPAGLLGSEGAPGPGAPTTTGESPEGPPPAPTA